MSLLLFENTLVLQPALPLSDIRSSGKTKLVKSISQVALNCVEAIVVQLLQVKLFFLQFKWLADHHRRWLHGWLR